MDTDFIVKLMDCSWVVKYVQQKHELELSKVSGRKYA